MHLRMNQFGWFTLTMAVGVGSLLAFATHAMGLSVILSILIGANLATGACYGFDKHLARAGQRRVPELALHVLSVLGCTPGAFVGQRLFRHKTRDRKFQVVFYAILLVQVAVLIAILVMRLREG